MKNKIIDQSLLLADFAKSIESKGYKIEKLINTEINHWIVDLPKKFPLIFFDFISNYNFESFEIGDICFFATDELKDEIFKDKIISQALLKEGFLQFGRSAYSYDPICFNLRSTKEAPIIWLDHEKILCTSQIKIVKIIANSFEEFISEYS